MTATPQQPAPGGPETEIESAEEFAERYCTRSTGGLKLWRKLRSDGWPPIMQVLCMNCNFGKMINKGVCPHVVVIRMAAGRVEG